ncbi:MAG TPA: methionine--tRNA ligase [Myxococcales bacterium]|jgi:methionyl-tRNA synthetase|nr:methionine--tRNA ligase [Myxococcales bacterium]
MRTLVTMALPYANGRLHLGHFVEAVQTDVYVRALRAMGRQIAFICADDMHGTPIEMSAAKAGIPPEEFVERIHREHREDYAAFAISFDEFYKTHSEENRLHTQRIYRELVKRGSVERRDVEQLYCEVDRRFLPDRYVRGQCPVCGAKDQYGDSCEVCGSTYEPVQLKDPYCALCKEHGRGEVRPVIRRSAHYFVKLSQYQDFLREWTSTPGRVQPDIRGFVARWLLEPLKDWDVSRDEPYFGFEIPDRPPGEEKKYFYVWLDAPTGYLSSTDHWARKHSDRVENWWGADSGTEIVHFIGKDIVYFHTLFWPAMLHASGWQVPAHVHVHGMLTVEGTKMSKTRGTFINARDYLSAGLDPEWLRYYFAANLGPTASDIDLSLAEMKNRVNGELLNNVGNLANRALSILWKSFSGKLGILPSDPEAVDLWNQASLSRAAAMQAYLRVDSRAAVQTTLALSAAANERLQRKQPWKMIATDPEGARRELTLAANVARICASMLQPVVPRFADGIVDQTGAPLPAVTDHKPLEETTIREPRPLVRRMEDDDVRKLTSRFVAEPTSPASAHAAAGAPVPHAEHLERKPEISIERFDEVDLRAGKVLAAERIPKADKLLKLTIDLGEGAPRTVVSGVAQSYRPEELVGRTVAVVANLPKKPLRGVESHGMVLFATGGPRGHTVVELGENVAPGTKVK